MLRGKSLQKRHLIITLFAFFFSLFFNIDMIEGCALEPVRGTKKDAYLPVVESVEPLPLSSVVDGLKILIASSALFAAASSFFLSFA
jgi:hypothetical protein